MSDNPATLVYFIGGGPGDPELLTLKAVRVLERADVVIYTDSLTDPRITQFCKPGVEVHGSAGMALEEIVGIILKAVGQGKTVARVHSGDPSIFGAVLEQVAALDKAGVRSEVIPGVSSVFAAAVALGVELTVPEVSQTVILTRAEGRTPMPDGEKLPDLARHQATLVLYLSSALITKVVDELLQGGYPPETPAALVYRASWPDQKIVRAPLKDLAARVRAEKITAHGIIIVGRVLDPALRESAPKSKLYDASFTHSFRVAKGRRGAGPTRKALARKGK
ncbi:MAG: precorrin-4 C(11)-methyltransferase [Dehalococcoidia bacterium]|nr:precorrin-4 C(11)-methyltransferase [Dehalococcoidia bacterium]